MSNLYTVDTFQKVWYTLLSSEKRVAARSYVPSSTSGFIMEWKQRLKEGLTTAIETNKRSVAVHDEAQEAYAREIIGTIADALVEKFKYRRTFRRDIKLIVVPQSLRGIYSPGDWDPVIDYSVEDSDEVQDPAA